MAYVWSVLFAALSLLAKASVVSLGLVLLVLDVYPLRRNRAVEGRPAATMGRLIAEKIPFLILGLAAGLLAIRAQRQAGAWETLATHDLASRLAQACYGLVFYLWKSVAPANLAPLYELPPRDVLMGPMLWGSAAAAGVIAWVAWRLRRRLPGLAAALIVYVIIIAPVLGIFQSGRQLVADRYSYLSCMGLAVLAGAAVLVVLRQPGAKDRFALAVLGVTALSVGLAHATMAQADIWQTDETLWRHAAALQPNSAIAHCNYGDALARRDKHEAAVVEYAHTLRLNPNDDVAWHHQGAVLVRMGQFDGALQSYLRALQINPNRRGAHLEFAELWLARGDAMTAVRVLEDGAQRTPNESEMLRQLAELRATCWDGSLRDGAAAMRWAERVIMLRGGPDAASLMTYASALAEVERYAEAVRAAEDAAGIARRTGADALTADIAQRLEQFRAGKPWRMEKPSQGP